MRRKKRNSKKIKNLLIYLSNNNDFLKGVCALLMIISVIEVFSLFIFGDKSVFTKLSILLILILSEVLIIFHSIGDTDKDVLRRNKMSIVLLSKKLPLSYIFIVIICILDGIINDIIFYYFKLGSGIVNFCIRAFVFIFMLIIFISLEEKIVKKINERYSKKLKY